MYIKILEFLCTFAQKKIMQQMRKISRQRDEQWALEVFDKAPYVTVGMYGSAGWHTLLCPTLGGAQG